MCSITPTGSLKFLVYQLVIRVNLFWVMLIFYLSFFFLQVNLVTNELFTVEAMEKSAEVMVKNFLYLIHLVWKKLKLTSKEYTR